MELQTNTPTEITLLQKKLDSYSLTHSDFVAPHELTVTITLSEYRHIVTQNAAYQQRLEALKETVANLKGQNELLAAQRQTTTTEG